MMIDVGIAMKGCIQHHSLLRLDKVSGHEIPVAMAASRPVASLGLRASVVVRGQPCRTENHQAVCCSPDMPAE